jgi:hypothetical protein
LLTVLFAASYTQSPLYTSNQNQYFLHGLAQAGRGFLHEDWLANTLDPTPVFSVLVAMTARYLIWDGFFYIWYALLMGIYLFSLAGIVSLYFDVRSSRARWWSFLSALILAHSAGLRYLLSQASNYELTYLLEDGLADQRLLGPVFQPSVFGVLLVLSIYLFLRKKPYLAALTAALAAIFHPTYLLGAAALTGAYILITIFLNKTGDGSNQTRPDPAASSNLSQAAGVGMIALLAVLPILAYVYTAFAATPPATSAQARHILVNVRIPHHALASWWFDYGAVIKIGIVLAALWMVRRTRLLVLLGVPSLIATVLTLTQVTLASDGLALLFPWRISTFLVPISTAVLLGALISWSFTRFPSLEGSYRRLVLAGCLTVLMLTVTSGALRFFLDLQRKANQPEASLLAYVAQNHRAGETYLTPVKMQDFRLATGSPAYIDFKSIPYQDEQVLEWHRRVQQADQFYKDGDCTLLEIIEEEGVTHVVWEAAGTTLSCPQLRETYRDQNYLLFEVNNRANSAGEIQIPEF